MVHHNETIPKYYRVSPFYCDVIHYDIRNMIPRLKEGVPFPILKWDVIPILLTFEYIYILHFKVILFHVPSIGCVKPCYLIDYVKGEF